MLSLFSCESPHGALVCGASTIHHLLQLHNIVCKTHLFVCGNNAAAIGEVTIAVMEGT